MVVEIMDKDTCARTVTRDLDLKILKKKKNTNTFGMSLFFQNKLSENSRQHFHIQKLSYRISFKIYQKKTKLMCHEPYTSWLTLHTLV